MNEGTPIIIKKKKSHGHAHHGGAWKVAYADFVTAMMAFFLVMWIMGMSESDRGAIQGYFNDPMGYTKSSPKGRPNIGFVGQPRRSIESNQTANARKEINDRRDVKQLEAKVKQEIAEGAAKGNADLGILLKNIQVRITNEGLEIEFVEGNGVAYFELGSSNVTPQAKKIMFDLSKVLARSGRIFKIDGHTDSRQYVGMDYDNFDLSTDRAQSIKRVLRQGGVPKIQIMSVRGFADTRLKIPDQPMNPNNRRVTLVLPYNRQKEEVLRDSSTLDDTALTTAIHEDLKMPVAPRKSEDAAVNQ